MAVQVFEINDCEWWAGEGSPLDILNAYISITGCTHEDATGDTDLFPTALTEAQLDKISFGYTADGIKLPQPMPFRDVLDAMVMTGTKFPCLFAVSES